MGYSERPVNRGAQFVDQPSSPAPGSFWIDVVPQQIKAQKLRDQIHKQADDEIRLGIQRQAGSTRTASSSEIAFMLERSRQAGLQNSEINYNANVYDESQETPSHIDLARGQISQRSMDFQTRDRSDSNPKSLKRKPERRDRKGKPSFFRSRR